VSRGPVEGLRSVKAVREEVLSRPRDQSVLKPIKRFRAIPRLVSPSAT
jgi:hypothetical protein